MMMLNGIGMPGLVHMDGKKTKKLLYVNGWHMDRAWRNALREHIGGKDDQVRT